MIYFSFFLSGLTALIYEITWSKLISLIFGTSIYGQSIVLAIFMGGMAIGAKVISEKVSKTHNTLLWYALLEGIIALFGFLSIYLRYFCEIFEFHNPMLDLFIKSIICSLFLMPSSIAMGGTFPVLFKYVKEFNESYHIKKTALFNISFLYVINTLGALCGILLANYYLISQLGIRSAILITSLINCSISLLILNLRNRHKSKNTAPTLEETEQQSSNLRRLPLLALAFSGAATMLYEISWSRILYFSLGSSTYTFSLIIFSFIAGLTLGANWIKRKQIIDTNAKKILICDMQVKAIFGAAIFIFISSGLPMLSGVLFSLCGEIYWKLHLIELVLLMLIITPVAFYIGASFPLLCTLVKEKGVLSEKEIGIAYSTNTLGSIIGSLLTGFVLIQLFGPFKVIWITFSIHIIIILIVSPRPLYKYLKPHSFIVLIAYLFIMFQFNFFTSKDLVSGNYARIYNNKTRYTPKYLAKNPDYHKAKAMRLQTKRKEYKIQWSKHGRISSISVLENGLNSRLVINGKTDASVGKFYASDMPTQTFLALLPTLLSQKQDQGLVVGLGSGVTTGILAHTTKSIDCLEIEPAVLDAAVYFSKYNLDVVNALNTNIIIGDARKYIRQCKKQYNFISAEPSNIWMSGVANLFTNEYFDDCKKLLTDQGVMIQWVHIYKISLSDFKIILKSFLKTFRTVEVWGSFNFGDIFLAGFKGSRNKLTKLKFDKTMKNFPYKQELNEIGISNSTEMSNFLLSIFNKENDQQLKDVQMNTDNHPLLEYSAAKNMFKLDTDKIYKFLEANPDTSSK